MISSAEVVRYDLVERVGVGDALVHENRGRAGGGMDKREEREEGKREQGKREERREDKVTNKFRKSYCIKSKTRSKCTGLVSADTMQKPANIMSFIHVCLNVKQFVKLL